MGRSPCCDKNGLKKGPWTPEEDAKLTHHIQIHGPGNWRTLPKIAGLQRCGKSCRLRWTNYLRPDIKRGRFSFEEEETIIQLHSVLGNKWSSIAARLPGRTDNEIKNYWNTHIRKRLLRMGIDPVTHAPRLDLSDLSSLLMSSSQLNLSNLIRLQTLVNPEALRVALSLLPSSSQNDQKHLLNYPQQYFENHEAPIIQPNHFENIINQQIPWTFATPSLHKSHMQGEMHTGHFPMGSTTSSSDHYVSHHDNLTATNTSDQTKADFSSDNNSSFQSFNSNNNNTQNFNFKSVMSTTPLSSPAPPNTASAPVISGSTEDERDNFCSNLFKFEFSEGFDQFDDFML